MRGSLDRAPDGVGDLAAAARPGVGRARRVGVDHAHARDVDAEGLGGDRGEAGLDAGHVGRAGDHGQAAVGVQPADRRRGLVAARPPADGDADALARAQLVAARPQRVVAHALEAGACAEHGERLTRRATIALAGDVAQPQLERVELQPAREVVDERLDGERRRRRGRAR